MKHGASLLILFCSYGSPTNTSSYHQIKLAVKTHAAIHLMFSLSAFGYFVVFAEIGCIRIYSKEPTGSKIAKTNKYKIFSHVYYSWINTSISNIRYLKYWTNILKVMPLLMATRLKKTPAKNLFLSIFFQIFNDKKL